VRHPAGAETHAIAPGETSPSFPAETGAGLDASAASIEQVTMEPETQRSAGQAATQDDGALPAVAAASVMVSSMAAATSAAARSGWMPGVVCIGRRISAIRSWSGETLR
jgi:hypothetical protein